jgi:hypothetical protein
MSGTFYNEWGADDFFNGCKNSGAMTECTMQVSLRSRTIPSCASSLYYDDVPKILAHCDIRYEGQGALLQGAIQLGPGVYLASSDDTVWTKQCAGKSPEPIPASTFAIVTMGCSCSLESNSFYIPAQLTTCESNINAPFIYQHPVNLALLYHAYPREEMEQYSAHSISAEPVVIEIPPINLKHQNWTNIAGQDKKFATSLKTAIESSDKHAEVFKTKSDYLAAATSATGTALVSGSSWFGIPVQVVLTVMTIYSSVVATYLLCKTSGVRAPQIFTVSNVFAIVSNAGPNVSDRSYAYT